MGFYGGPGRCRGVQWVSAGSLGSPSGSSQDVPLSAKGCRGGPRGSQGSPQGAPAAPREAPRTREGRSVGLPGRRLERFQC